MGISLRYDIYCMRNAILLIQEKTTYILLWLKKQVSWGFIINWSAYRSPLLCPGFRLVIVSKFTQMEFKWSEMDSEDSYSPLQLVWDWDIVVIVWRNS